MFEKARKLSTFEIEKLSSQGVSAKNWDTISVAPEFDASRIFNVHFGQGVYLGQGVEIRSVGARIENTIIEDGVKIENIGAIHCSSDANFGIGVKVAAVNENSGRAVPMYLGITAQSAYMLAMYRHRTDFINKFTALIEQQRLEKSNAMSVIGKGSTLFCCGALDSVHLGENTTIEGATLLKNGTVYGDCKIGYGVIMQDFMCAKGSVVENQAQLKRCFVGECTHIDSGFSAVDSLFFANCDMANGECCSVFAGPYTVSHHKSSLLIAGLFSFFNAGSGSNQSNHLFKTGAVHQAIHERGCKYGSNAYIMAPAHTGAYNVVLSRHSSHHDTSDFPFSYLLEDQGKSILMPAAALKSSGSERDIKKWAERDKRKGEKLDLIIFDKWNPYIGERLIRAINICESMLEKDAPSYTHGRVKISAGMLKRGLDLYKLALSATLANLLEVEQTTNNCATDTWVDLAGLYAPKQLVDSLKIDNLENFHTELTTIYNNYSSYASTWARNIIGTEADIKSIIEQGKKDEQTLKSYTDKDLKSDSSTLMQTSYGIDESYAEIKLQDFMQVRNL